MNTNNFDSEDDYDPKDEDWSSLKGKTPTIKQFNFISSLVDQIGYRNSLYKTKYLEVLNKYIYDRYKASKIIGTLLREKNSRFHPKLIENKGDVLTVSELADFAFCTASFSIGKTYERVQTAVMLEGVEKHNQNFLESLLLDIPSDKKTQKRFFVEPTNQTLILSEMRQSSIVFRGHTEQKVTPFYSNDRQLCGIPDYIFQKESGERFVVEEKHSWNDNRKEEPWKNNLIQLLGYIFGLESLNVKFGYIVYFNWFPTYEKHRFRSNDKVYTYRTGESYDLQIFKIERSEERRLLFNEHYKKVREYLKQQTIQFESSNISANKCFHCSSRIYCRHKSGSFDTVKLPYYKNAYSNM